MPTDDCSQVPPTPSPSDLEGADADGHQPARFLDSPSTRLAATTTCANCERRFAGDYCPTCGQKADAELTVWDIVGGFFRDLFDAERGLWPTLKGLTIAPGRTLRHYPSGARRQYVNPGRYLLFALLFWGAVAQLQKWAGVDETSAGSDPAVDAVEVALQVVFPSSAGGSAFIAVTCLFAGLLGLLYHQLFASQTRNRASAVAIAVFVAAHGFLLTTILNVSGLTQNGHVIPDQAILDRQSGISSKLAANPEKIPHRGAG